ncbi:uncharacterized protein [Dermacentor albipictus]
MARVSRLFHTRAPTAMRMSERLYSVAIMWRVSGCFFVANLDPRDLDRARVTWKSVYSLYSLLCAFILFSFRMLQLWAGAFGDTDSRGALSTSLLELMRNVIGLESLVAFVVMAVRSSTILRFLRNASAFEASVSVPGFHRAKRPCPVPYACHVLSFACVVLYSAGHIGWLLIATYRHMATSQILELLYGVTANALYMASDYGNKATARAVCEVLVDYVIIQADILAQKQKSGLHLKDVEELRTNMSTIQTLKEEINMALNPCIVFYCLRAFSVFSISGYMLVKLGFSQVISALILFYLLNVAFGLTDLAYVSHALEKETENVKLSLADIITVDMPSEHVSKIRFIYNTIDPRSMCLSGGGFFAINARTLMH